MLLVEEVPGDAGLEDRVLVRVLVQELQKIRESYSAVFNKFMFQNKKKQTMTSSATKNDCDNEEYSIIMI